jgi:hypothetical protein
VNGATTVSIGFKTTENQRRNFSTAKQHTC